MKLRKAVLFKITINLGYYNGTLLQYSCMENPMDGGAWKAAVHGVAKSRTRLSDFTLGCGEGSQEMKQERKERRRPLLNTRTFML